MHILEYLFNIFFSRITIHLKREYFILSVTFHQRENTEMLSLHFQTSTDFSKRHTKDFIWKYASYFQILYKKDTSFPILCYAIAVPLTLTSLSNLGSHMVIIKDKQHLTLETTVFPMSLTDERHLSPLE